MKKTSFMLMALLVAPAMVSAQTKTQATSQTSAQSNAQVPAQATAASQASSQARIDATLQAAARAHIPTALLESKVQEGQAKHVPTQRIAAAVEARYAALKQASQTMDQAGVQGESDSELAVAADALQAGVSANSLVKVYREAPADRRVVAMAVITDLVRLGHSSATALARVSGAVGNTAALANLQAQVASQLRLGGLGSTLDANGLVHVH